MKSKVEIAVVYYKLISQHLLGDVEENRDSLLTRQMTSGSAICT